MAPDPTSLENLRDLVTPPPAPWWPPAPGWFALGAIVFAAALFLALRAYRHYRQNAYRRQALRELETTDSPQEIAALLKRTALAAYPRSKVASLSGSAWTDWLTTTSNTPLPAEVATQLTHSIFSKENTENAQTLRAYTKSWIIHHIPNS
ncbi:MAG: DUF4381 domain-containing protein [Verrucomicrobiota bacterium]